MSSVPSLWLNTKPSRSWSPTTGRNNWGWDFATLTHSRICLYSGQSQNSGPLELRVNTPSTWPQCSVLSRCFLSFNLIVFFSCSDMTFSLIWGGAIVFLIQMPSFPLECYVSDWMQRFWSFSSYLEFSWLEWTRLHHNYLSWMAWKPPPLCWPQHCQSADRCRSLRTLAYF